MQNILKSTHTILCKLQDDTLSVFGALCFSLYLHFPLSPTLLRRPGLLIESSWLP